MMANQSDATRNNSVGPVLRSGEIADAVIQLDDRAAPEF